MTLGIDAILDGIVSDALSLGVFERVNVYEPKSAPVNKGITMSIWTEFVRPYAGGSGLSAVTAVVCFSARITTNMLSEPQSAIDPNLIKALDALFSSLAGGFTLSGASRDVDLLGETGAELRADAGYVDQDGKKFRAFLITIPVIVNDAWNEAA